MQTVKSDLKKLQAKLAAYNEYRNRRRLRSVASPEMSLLRERLHGRAVLGDDNKRRDAQALARDAFRPRDWSHRERLKDKPAPKQTPRLRWMIAMERGYSSWSPPNKQVAPRS